MSRSFRWVKCQPLDANSFSCDYSASDFDKLLEVFGDEIGPTEVPKLRNFAQALDQEIYTEIADLILKYGAIQIKVEY